MKIHHPVIKKIHPQRTTPYFQGSGQFRFELGDSVGFNDVEGYLKVMQQGDEKALNFYHTVRHLNPYQSVQQFNNRSVFQEAFLNESLAPGLFLLLQQEDAPVNDLIPLKDKTKEAVYPPYCFALTQTDLLIFKALINHPKFDPYQRDADGNNLLHHLLAQQKSAWIPLVAEARPDVIPTLIQAQNHRHQAPPMMCLRTLKPDVNGFNKLKPFLSQEQVTRYLEIAETKANHILDSASEAFQANHALDSEEDYQAFTKWLNERIGIEPLLQYCQFQQFNIFNQFQAEKTYIPHFDFYEEEDGKKVIRLVYIPK